MQDAARRRRQVRGSPAKQTGCMRPRLRRSLATRSAHRATAATDVPNGKPKEGVYAVSAERGCIVMASGCRSLLEHAYIDTFSGFASAGDYLGGLLQKSFLHFEGYLSQVHSSRRIRPGGRGGRGGVAGMNPFVLSLSLFGLSLSLLLSFSLSLFLSLALALSLSFSLSLFLSLSN